MLFSLLLLMLAPEPAAPQAPGVDRPTFADAVQMANDGREPEALAAFQRIVTANPNDRDARLWIARLHERAGAFDRAEAVYRSILLEDTANVDAMVGVATALLARDETAEAIVLLERAERLAPQNDTVLATLGRAHRHAGRDARAIAYFELASALAPTAQHRLELEEARRAYGHRVETRGFGEEYSGSAPNSRSGELALNLRVTDRLRVSARGQVQRKFGSREERGGAGVEWRWTPAATLRVQALVGPEARVMPEGDYLAEIDYADRQAVWTAGVRYFDFEGARTTTVSPAVSWRGSDRVSMGLRYAFSVSESTTLAGRENGHSVHARAAYRLYPRLWITAGYAGGVEDFENFSIDRIGDFRANGASGGLRYDLPTLTSLVGMYEHQWRSGGVEMRRLTVAIAQRF